MCTTFRLSPGATAAGVRDFYKNHFVGRMPADTRVESLSRTVSKDRVVDELILTFTHDVEIDYMLPGIAPTGKRVEIPHVVIMQFDNGKIARTHLLGSGVRARPSRTD